MREVIPDSCTGRCGTHRQEQSAILDLSIMLANLGYAMSSLASLVTLGGLLSFPVAETEVSERLSSLSKIAQLVNMCGGLQPISNPLFRSYVLHIISS